MPSDPDDDSSSDRGRWLPEDLRIAEYIPLLGALYYAVGWAAANRFYGRFGVDPEEVGIDFGYILVRVGFLLTASAMIAYLLWLIGTRAKSLTLNESASGCIHYLIMAACIVGTVALFVAANPWRGHLNFLYSMVAVMLWLVALLFAAVVIIGASGDLFGYERTSGKYSARTISARWVRILGVAWIVLPIPLLLVGIEGALDDVRAGRATTINAFPGVRGLTAELVNVGVQSSSTEATQLEEECMILLGAGGSFVVLYDFHDDVVFRVASENVTLSSTC